MYKSKVTLLFTFILVTMSVLGQTESVRAKLTISANETDTLILKYKNDILYFKEHKNIEREVNTMHTLALYYQNNYEKDSAITYYKKAIKLADKMPEKKAILLSDLGYLYTGFEDRVNGLSYGLEAVKIAEKVSVTQENLAYIYSNIAMTYDTMLDFDNAVMYHKKAIIILENIGNVDLFLKCLFNLVFELPSIGKEDEALRLLDGVQKKYSTVIAKYDYQFLLHYAYTYIYVRFHQLVKAKEHFNKLLSLPEDVRMSPQFKDQFIYTAINYYTATQEFAKTKPYLEIRQKQLEEHFDLTTIAINEEFLFLADSAQGNYFDALKHYQEFDKWKDSLFSVDKEKQLNNLKLKYQTEKKDENIALLEEKQSLQEKQLRQEAYLRYIYISGLILLTLFFGVLYYAYNSKKKNNQILRKKQDEINEQNKQLQQLVADKEWLLKEIHHRVKNNLQIVISLLNSQSAYLNNKEALQALQNSQHRMNAMSLIHQKLYMSDNLATIDMKWYITELIKYIKDCFTDNHSNLTFNLNITAVEFDVSQAVPIGLIINEAVINAIKYAFTDNKEAIISISLLNTNVHTYELKIADNGKGLPIDFDIQQQNSLGTNLMKGLTSQLEGELELINQNGLTIKITFMLNDSII